MDCIDFEKFYTISRNIINQSINIRVGQLFVLQVVFFFSIKL